jgi:uncharacterized protein
MAITKLERSMEELSRDECLRLLTENQIGRVAVSLRGRPAIIPVNYVIDGEVVVFRARPGNELKAAVLSYVAFEVDHVDVDRKEGWYVELEGVGQSITRGLDEESERRRSLPIEVWDLEEREHWIEILDPVIVGRRLHTVVVRSNRY